MHFNKVVVVMFTLLPCTLSAEPSEIDGAPISIADRINAADQFNYNKTIDDNLKLQVEIQKKRNLLKQLVEDSKESPSDGSDQQKLAEMQDKLKKYESLFSSMGTSAAPPTRTIRPASRTAPPLNLRVIDTLMGEGIKSRATITVLDDKGNSKGDLEVRSGSRIQGWTVEEIAMSEIIVSKNGTKLTYGPNGLL